MHVDIEHAEMFPYAIALAKARGAGQLFVGEPRIRGDGHGHWVVPDVLSLRNTAEKPYVIVECEKSHGKIFDSGGKIEKWSEDDELREKAEFHFILRGKAWYRRRQIERFLGSDACYYKFEELQKELQLCLL